MTTTGERCPCGQLDPGDPCVSCGATPSGAKPAPVDVNEGLWGDYAVCAHGEHRLSEATDMADCGLTTSQWRIVRGEMERWGRAETLRALRELRGEVGRLADDSHDDAIASEDALALIDARIREAENG